MRTSLKGVMAIALLCSTLTSCTKEETEQLLSISPEAENYKADVSCKWNDMELQLIKSTPGFVPPVAARALAYTHLSAYEAIQPGMKNYRTIHDALYLSYRLPQPDPNETYNWALVANAAYFQSVKAFYGNVSGKNQVRVDSLYQALNFEFSKTETTDIIERSFSYGAEVADVIFEWSKGDRGHEGYSSLYPASYVSMAGPGKWEPTPPSYNQIPLLPYWGYNRPFLPASVSESCQPPATYSFSSDSSSLFYKDALEVYMTRNTLSQEQKEVAQFWEDGSETFTPPGHNMNIASQLIREDKIRLDKAIEIYVRMGIACNDAFIACWKAKYNHNLMRPVTFIQRYIAMGWKPLLNTPPHPEYTSGHSTVTGACSEVLTAFFGSRKFTDSTNTSFGYAPRTFDNFQAAANEAALSRLYGGIHFRNGNERGLICGRQIGKNVAGIQLQRK